VFPAGAQIAIVSGDPGKAGPFTIQLKLPDGWMIPPHSHPTDEHLQTIEGTFMYAMGDTVKKADMKALHVGQSATVPATMHHYAGAKGATIIQVSGMGPFVLTYVNPADDPQKAMPAKPAPGGH
jgi:quercetin dioxygenase-like cupin family protein